MTHREGFREVVAIAKQIKEGINPVPSDEILKVIDFVIECGDLMPKGGPVNKDLLVALAERGLIMTIEAKREPTPPEPVKAAWSVGTIDRAICLDEKIVGMVDNAYLAKRIVDAMNGDAAAIRNQALSDASNVCERIATFDPEDVHYTALKCKRRIEGMK